MEHTIFLEKVNVYSYIWTIFYIDRHLLIAHTHRKFPTIALQTILDNGFDY